MVLDIGSPQHRILEPAFHLGINTLLAKLPVWRDASVADPDPSSPAYHQEGPIRTAGKAQVRQAFNNGLALWTKFKSPVFPWAIKLISQVVSINHIDYIATILQLEYFRIMSFTYGFFHFIWT